MPVVDEVGLDNASCPLGAGTTPLTGGVTVSSSLPAVTGASCEFSFAMSGNTITSSKVELFGLASDFDLYVKRGSAPTTSSFDCRPYSGGLTAETCTLANSPAGTTVFVMVRRFSGSGAFSIRASEVIPPPTCSLGHGVHNLVTSVTANLTADVGAFCMFKFTPNTAADFASIRMTLTSSDYDLYVKKGAPPTTTVWDCRPYSGGLVAEQCDSLITDATPYFAMVRRFSGASSSFTVTGASVVIPQLNNAEPVAGVALQGAMTYWKVVMPAVNDLGNPTSALAIALAGDVSETACRASADTAAACIAIENADRDVCITAIDFAAPGTCVQAGLPAKQLTRQDADLYVRFASGLPTTSVYNCRGFSWGTLESCTFSNDAVGARAEAATQFGAARAQVVGALGASCVLVDPAVPAVCVPTFPANPAHTQIVPFAGVGKYFIGVRGYSPGASEYNLVAVWA